MGRIVQTFVFLVVPVVLVRDQLVFESSFRRGWEVPALGVVLLGTALWCWVNAHRTTLLQRWVSAANRRLSGHPRYASAMFRDRSVSSTVRIVTEAERNGTTSERSVTIRSPRRSPMSAESGLEQAEGTFPFRLDRAAGERDLEVIRCDARNPVSRGLDWGAEAFGWFLELMNPRHRHRRFEPPTTARGAIVPAVVYGCVVEMFVVVFMVPRSGDPIMWLVGALWVVTTVALVVRTVQWGRIDRALERRAEALKSALQ